MKRILALLLALACVLPVLGCAGDTPLDTDSSTTPGTSTPTDSSSDTADDTTAPADDGMLYDSLGEANFNQADYIVFGGSNRATTAVTAQEENGEPINDNQVKSRRNVEDRFDVKIRYEDIGTDDTSVVRFMENLVSSGDDTYAIGIGQDGNTINTSLKGTLYNINTIPQFDFDQPWWSDATKMLAFGDKYYAASSFLSYYCLYMTKMIVVNKDMLTDLGLEMPYDKVLAGEWYLDDFAELVAKGTKELNGDGVMNEYDQYGFSWSPGGLYTFQNSMDVTVFGKDEDNMPYVNFDMEKAMQYLGVMEPLLEQHAYINKDSYGAPFFAQGKALTVYCMLREVCTILRETDITYGFLPAPKLDENQKEYKTVSVDILWGMPAIHDDKVEMIGYVTEALSCQHYNYVRPAFFETTMKTRLSDSPNDAAMLNMIPESLSIDFGYAYYQVITPMQYLMDLTNKVKLGTLASTYGKISSSLETQMNNVVEKIEKLP